MDNRKLNVKRNQEKSAYTLRGILRGLVSDEKLNNMELLFLDIWLKEQSKLPIEGDVLDLIDMISDVLADGVVTQEEKAEILEQIDCILEYGTKEADEDERCINELIGIITGISCDDELVMKEFNFLDKWLENHLSLSNTWPIGLLRKRVLEIKEDNVVTSNEREHLLETLKKITGTRFSEDGAAADNVAEVWFDSIDEFNHQDKKLCFTGKFITGPRSLCEVLATQRGAITSKNVTKDVNVLVIGSTSNKDWRFTSHGRKIEKAMKYKSEGQDILIISENAWSASLNN